jgi:hypothetical protein
MTGSSSKKTPNSRSILSAASPCNLTPNTLSMTTTDGCFLENYVTLTMNPTADSDSGSPPFAHLYRCTFSTEAKKLRLEVEGLKKKLETAEGWKPLVAKFRKLNAHLGKRAVEIDRVNDGLRAQILDLKEHHDRLAVSNADLLLSSTAPSNVALEWPEVALDDIPIFDFDL